MELWYSLLNWYLFSVISTVDDEYKRTEGFMNYYGIAHLYKEKITEQPQIMRYGKLKPYQVRCFSGE